MLARNSVPRRRAALVSLLVFIAAGALPGAAGAKGISRDQAIARALAEQPDLALAAADVEIGEADRVGASVHPFNPELGLSGGHVRAAGVTLYDYEVSVGQTIELGGKRSHRIDAADAKLQSTRARADWTRWMVTLRVRRAFDLALVARARVATAMEAEAAADEMKRAVDERMRLHAATQLEINVAIADAGRAKRARLDAERAYVQARYELGAAIGAAPGEDVEPDGELGGAPVVTSEDALVARALAERADLRAARADRATAAANVSVEDAGAIPDVTVSAAYAREREPGLTLDVISVGVAVPLPFFNRNQGGRAVARAELHKATITEDATRRAIERDVRASYRGYAKAHEAVLAFDLDVVEKLGENLALARESFQSGKIGLLELNVVRRDLVETRFAYLDAQQDAVEALVALEAAVGDLESQR